LVPYDRDGRAGGGSRDPRMVMQSVPGHRRERRNIPRRTKLLLLLARPLVGYHVAIRQVMARRWQ
jgi:hypothetical protein